MYQRYTSKPNNTSDVKTVLKAIWADLPRDPINAAILLSRRRPHACIKIAGGHFEHAV